MYHVHCSIMSYGTLLGAAFATLAYHPEGDLLDRLAHHAASIVRTFRPQATSNSLWAFAKLAYVPCQPFLLTSASQARGPNPNLKHPVLLMKLLHVVSNPAHCCPSLESAVSRGPV